MHSSDKRKTQFVKLSTIQSFLIVLFIVVSFIIAPYGCRVCDAALTRNKLYQYVNIALEQGHNQNGIIRNKEFTVTYQEINGDKIATGICGNIKVTKSKRKFMNSIKMFLGVKK